MSLEENQMEKKGKSNMTGMLGLAGVGALVAACWNYVKLIFSKIYGLFLVRYKTSDSDVSSALAMKLFRDCQRPKHVERSLLCSMYYIRPLKKSQHVLFEGLPKGLSVFWLGKVPIIVNIEINDDGRYVSTAITFPKWFVNHDKFIKDAIDYYNKITETDNDKNNYNNFYVEKFHGNAGITNFNNDEMERDVASSGPIGNSIIALHTNIPLHWKRSDIGMPVRDDPTENMYLNADAQEALEESEKWIKSKDWYQDRDIPWKRGWLLYGEPGTGKTSFVRNVAMKLNIPIMIFDMATMTNKDFSSKWKWVKNRTPCIVLLEDIDSVFKGRENITGIENSMTFDCLLNCVDGVEDSDGLLVIMTTNKIEHIDSAIAKTVDNGIMPSRPGRIDRIFEMTNPDEEGRRKIATRILKGHETHIDETVFAGNGETGSQFQERCARKALQLHWEAQE